MIEPIALNRNLILEDPEFEEDGSGGFLATWTKLGSLWAHVAPRKGRETMSGGRPRSRVAYRILVRAAPVGAKSRPRATQRLRDGTRIFEILSVTEADPRGRYLEIEAEEGAQL